MEEMTSYDVAYLQFKEETSGATKEKFDKLIDEHGWDYVVFYENRYHETMAGDDCYDPECY